MRCLRCVTCAMLLAVAALTSTDASAQPSEPRDSITAAEIRGHVFFLAGEELGGRWPGSLGLQVASEYAASQLRAAGLRPVFMDHGTPSYFQRVPLVRRSVRSAPVLKVRGPSGEQTLVHGRDFTWFTGSPPAEDGRPRAVVSAGYAIREPESGWDDVGGLDLEGKIVVIRMGIPAAGLPDVLRARYGRSNAFMRKLTNLIPRKPAAVFITTTPDIETQWKSLPTIDMNPPFAYRDPIAGGVAIPFTGFLRADVAKAVFSGSSGWEEPGEVKGHTAVLSAPTVDEELAAWNVAGLVEGRDPALRDQIVVVSAHLDHLAPDPDGATFPGANDNASGSAALLEIAEAMASHPPRRSVLFVLFTGEEGGAMGSMHFLSRPPFPRGRLVADINMDMIGRTEAESGEGRVQYAVDSEVVQPALTRVIREVNHRTLNWPLRFEHPRGLGGSDHQSFEAYRIPAVNFYTGRVPDTHKSTDTPDTIDYDKAEAIARLVFEVARELGERDPIWK